MIDFDFDWNGITFTMCAEQFDDANDSNWTDIDFAGSYCSIGSNGELAISAFTDETQTEIRMAAYNHAEKQGLMCG